MDIISFFNSWQFVVLFYAGIILAIYLNRKKFEFQGKIIALYKTDIGLKAMDKIADKHGKLVRWLGYAGIVIGYLGMVFIIYMIFKGVFDLIYLPEAPPVITPVIPGVQIPGSPIKFPLFYTLIALFVAIVIHEFSHGVVARAHKVKVKSSGFGFMGPIPLAFVEPDDKSLQKKKENVQNSVFAAGPFSNILTAIFVIILMAFVISPVISSSFEPIGVRFSQVTEGSPADIAGVESEIIYEYVNGNPVTGGQEFLRQIENITANDTVVIGNDEVSHNVVAGKHPQLDDQGYLGVNIETAFTNEGTIWFQLVIILIDLLNWIMLISLGLGFANLLPIGPVDGGRMYQIFSWKILGKEKGNTLWIKTAILFLILIAILLFVPIFRAII